MDTFDAAMPQPAFRSPVADAIDKAREWPPVQDAAMLALKYDAEHRDPERAPGLLSKAHDELADISVHLELVLADIERAVGRIGGGENKSSGIEAAPSVADPAEPTLVQRHGTLIKRMRALRDQADALRARLDKLV